MEKLRNASCPFHKFKLKCSIRRRWCNVGFILILVNVGLFIIYLAMSDIQTTLNIAYSIDYSRISWRSVPVLQHRFCPKNSTIEKEAPFSLPCGMTIRAMGRLGNLMGQYAALFALSEINKRPAVILPEMADALRSYFTISLPTIEPGEQTYWKSRWKEVSLNDWMEPFLENLTDPFTYLVGFPCSWTFYHHIRDQILQEFKFHDHILKQTQDMLNYYREGRNSVTFIGVHNRRSDYVRLMAGLYRGVVAHAGFFQVAFNYFELKYPDAIFLVISDDMDWCRQNMNNSKGNIYFVGDNNIQLPIYDLALMANCNHSIITIGTFGYWGAYLAGGETVYLFNYTLPDSPFLEVLDYEKFYLPNWIPISADLSAFKEPKMNAVVPCIVVGSLVLLGLLFGARRYSKAFRPWISDSWQRIVGFGGKLCGLVSKREA